MPDQLPTSNKDIRELLENQRSYNFLCYNKQIFEIYTGMVNGISDPINYALDKENNDVSVKNIERMTNFLNEKLGNQEVNQAWIDFVQDSRKLLNSKQIQIAKTYEKTLTTQVINILNKYTGHVNSDKQDVTGLLNKVVNSYNKSNSSSKTVKKSLQGLFSAFSGDMTEKALNNAVNQHLKDIKQQVSINLTGNQTYKDMQTIYGKKNITDIQSGKKFIEYHTNKKGRISSVTYDDQSIKIDAMIEDKGSTKGKSIYTLGVKSHYSAQAGTSKIQGTASSLRKVINLYNAYAMRWGTINRGSTAYWKYLNYLMYDAQAKIEVTKRLVYGAYAGEADFLVDYTLDTNGNFHVYIVTFNDMLKYLSKNSKVAVIKSNSSRKNITMTDFSKESVTVNETNLLDNAQFPALSLNIKSVYEATHSGN